MTVRGHARGPVEADEFGVPGIYQDITQSVGIALYS